MLNITIFQIDLKKDEKAVAFDSFDMLSKYQGTSEINSGIYLKVFEGDVNCNNLEEIYYMFNMERPDGYEGRSLSVSDIVGIKDQSGKTTYHYCDSIGFKQVAFTPSLAAK